VLHKDGKSDARSADLVQGGEHVRVQRSTKKHLVAPEVAGQNVTRPFMVKECIEQRMIEKRVVTLIYLEVDEPNDQRDDKNDGSIDQSFSYIDRSSCREVIKAATGPFHRLLSGFLRTESS
jgi:hypothetical protein